MNFRHLVAELRQLIQYMRKKYTYIGLFGMSSGGFQSLLASNCEDLDYLLLFMTGCQLGSITWEGKLTTYVRKDLEARGINEAALSKAWSISDEWCLAHNCKAKNIKHFITMYDKVVPTPYQYRLWEALGKQEMRTLPSAHYSGGLLAQKVVSDSVNFIRQRQQER